MSDLLKVSNGGNFYIQEFLSPWWMQQAKSSVHARQGLRLNNPAMITGTQLIRDHVAESVTINDWYNKGHYSESCLRTPHTLGDESFAIFSGHMFWGAADLKFKSSDIEDVANLILRNPKTFYMISAIENTDYTRSSKGKLGRDWLHVVFGYRPDTSKNRIKLFNP